MNLTSVSIPNSVTIIDAYAFQLTGLTSVIIPGNTEINGAFQECENLTTVTFSNGTCSINNAFDDCPLTTVTIYAESPYTWNLTVDAFGDPSNEELNIYVFSDLVDDPDFEDAAEGWSDYY